MHWRKPDKQLNRPPLRLLWLPTFDSPLAPMPIAVLRRGVEAALPIIQDGGAVLSHCKYGIHRSVAMACCVLIGTDYSAADAMQLVKEKRPVADPYRWYIRERIIKFERDMVKRRSSQS
jgi:protein-tyrosine phosphatase